MSLKFIVSGTNCQSDLSTINKRPCSLLLLSAFIFTNCSKLIISIHVKLVYINLQKRITLRTSEQQHRAHEVRVVFVTSAIGVAITRIYALDYHKTVSDLQITGLDDRDLDH